MTAQPHGSTKPVFTAPLARAEAIAEIAPAYFGDKVEVRAAPIVTPNCVRRVFHLVGKGLVARSGFTSPEVAENIRASFERMAEEGGYALVEMKVPDGVFSLDLKGFYAQVDEVAPL